LVLAIIIAGGVFAQDAKNWIAGNVGLLGAGIQYERVLTDKISVGTGFYWYSTFFILHNLGIEVNVRFHPFSGKIGNDWQGIGEKFLSIP
jgi:hypothetical protein